VKGKGMKRGYFVYGYDETWGIAVIAPTARSAKNIAYATGELIDEDWIEIHARWMRDVDVSGLDVGVLRDLHEGLLRGFYMYIESKCDMCSEESQLELCNGKALCPDCIEKEYESRTKAIRAKKSLIGGEKEKNENGNIQHI
jgi:hypothetical protein